MINICVVVGTVERDPEEFKVSVRSVRHSFVVQTDRRWRDESGKWKSGVDPVPVVAWNKEFVMRDVRAGHIVYVIGRWQRREYRDRITQEMKQESELVAEEVRNLTLEVNERSGNIGEREQ